jgi:hypothetical protein
MSKSGPSYEKLTPEERERTLAEAKRALDFQRLQSDKTPEQDVAAGKRKPN